MKEYEIENSNNSFIAGWVFDDTAICDQLIDYHKQAPNKIVGQYGRIGKMKVNKDHKDSLDVQLKDPILFNEYNRYLQLVADQYIKKYSYCDFYSKWGVIELIQIQQYLPGGGFHAWHTERTSAITPNASRHLVFMTYLNDVNDGGETEWYYQKIKVQPRKGLTVIWPGDWTHTHRGVTSPTEEKYIITGWFNFTDTP
jgi:prolyl 4-hydroxylase